MNDRVWRDSVEVPRISSCEDVSRYDAGQIHGEIERLKAAGTWHNLFAAGRAWRAAAENLEGLQEKLESASALLADGWESEDSVAAQQALQRIHTSAGNLAQSSREVYGFSDSSADSLQRAVAAFPPKDGGSGFLETAGRTAGGAAAGPLGSMVAGAVGSAMDGVFNREDPNEKSRQALAELNSQYSADNTRLPSQVAVELPLLDGSGRISEPEEDDDDDGGGFVPPGPPGRGAFGSAAPGSGGFETTSVPPGPSSGVTGMPSPGGAGGMSSTAMPPGPGGGTGFDPPAPGAGFTGGLAGAGVVNPAGPGAGGIGVGGGAGLPPGGVGSGGGGVGAGGMGAAGVGGAAALGAGAGGVGRGAGGAGGGLGGRGVAGGGAGAGAGGRAGMAGGVMPMGAGGPAAGGGGRGAAGAGRTGGVAGAGGAAAGGRGGMAGGMMPMGAAGRGSGGEDGRDTWLVEDDDPWGGDSDAPPGVIR